MKKVVLAYFLALIILTATACQAGGSENLNIIPFSERRFIYTNGLLYEEKNSPVQEGDTTVYISYPLLSGFKNKELQEKLNKEITSEAEGEMNGLLAAAAAENGGKTPAVSLKESASNITYNCNNVIFIECCTHVEYTLSSGEADYRNKIEAFGYDLNSGVRLQLKDLFKKGSGYEKMVNQFISLYIIENNFDDPDSGYMSKPFQGIREGQSFSFDISGLKIIMDEKNDEFQDPGYPVAITVPLSTIGEELAVFDRYFDGKADLFEHKGIRKLLPNLSGFRVSNLLQESKETYSLYVEEGEFVNISEAEVKSMLDSLTECRLDVAGFKKKAEAQASSNPGKYFGSLGHSVSTALNAGGYMSIIVRDSYYENGTGQETRTFINYDLDRKRLIKLKDIFVPDFDYKAAIAVLLSGSDKDRISEDNFSFDEYGVEIYLTKQPGEKEYRSFWVPYEKIGWDKLAMF